MMDLKPWLLPLLSCVESCARLEGFRQAWAGVRCHESWCSCCKSRYQTVSHFPTTISAWHHKLVELGSAVAVISLDFAYVSRIAPDEVAGQLVHAGGVKRRDRRAGAALGVL